MARAVKVATFTLQATLTALFVTGKMKDKEFSF